jgi:hypothetical protein
MEWCFDAILSTQPGEQRAAICAKRETSRAATAPTMRDRLTALGCSEIEVIDDDLGRSA